MIEGKTDTPTIKLNLTRFFNMLFLLLPRGGVGGLLDFESVMMI